QILQASLHGSAGHFSQQAQLEVPVRLVVAAEEERLETGEILRERAHSLAQDLVVMLAGSVDEDLEPRAHGEVRPWPRSRRWVVAGRDRCTAATCSTTSSSRRLSPSALAPSPRGPAPPIACTRSSHLLRAWGKVPCARHSTPGGRAASNALGTIAGGGGRSRVAGVLG